ncbi:succinate dehydrogenase cytochrome b560 subunit, mitochondrial-like isoform X2 [Daktulosphaira vitifoliae]|uniref:succinate dehydrogenase cytochrome b560 subunit, mitochondrial-like isoform X2 n=1 Tax=Daktulosphaira vitifoliae TaxID=58002 RepID=UPI0021AA9274|nr:succinate dehydrogenase cytochrome b560 subunit, mitochondrial-like isoform X2 [Daktulosphaira vitifoliae]
MALLLKSVQSSLIRRSIFNNSPIIYRSITMQVKNAQEVQYKPGETHDEKNSRLNRPMSPHLTIYQLQLTTILSITHRGTGVALSGLTAAAGSVFLFYDVPTFLEYVRALDMPIACLLATKAMIAFPFFYHYLNGIRHLDLRYGMLENA